MTETLAAPTGAEQVRWDLTELYESPHDPRIEAVLAEALDFAREFEQSYQGRVAQLAPAEFVDMMKSLEDHYDRIARPSLYASLLHTLKTQDHQAGRLVGRIREAGAERGRHMVFFSLELAALTDEEAQRLYEDPQAAVYKHTVEQERKERPHQLSHVEETLLTEISPVGVGSWTRLFEELCAAITAPLEGEEVPLATALSLIRDGDREIRKKATLAITEGLRRDLRTRTYAFNVVLQSKAIADRLRKYDSWISSRNLANETSDEAVEALVKAVTARYDVVERYYTVKRRLLGVDKLYEWDRYAPIEEVERQLTWDQARDLVLGSYHRFSPRAANLVQDFFDQPWIDAPVEEGKQSGAYCAGATPRFHPFVMMNFTGKFNDALTLAHELGHGLHDRLAAKQHIFDYHPPLTLAETASVFGEQLTFDRLMAEERDSKVRLAMLCHQVEDAFATIFRQVAMNRFEDAAHTARRAQGELSPDHLGEIWQEKVQAMFGDSLELTPDHLPWWSYVGHFVGVPGYVYAYAFGNLLALSLYQRYREVGPDFVDTYLDFLGAGGSQAPDELVKSVGMDITDPGFWDAGLKILDGMVAQVEDLSKN
ncbi:MAG TPA: M3 family oligoendopeptidase [Candidatus Dormibacteraeota bacterium]|jgi:oligoendopeptidase F